MLKVPADRCVSDFFCSSLGDQSLLRLLIQSVPLVHDLFGRDLLGSLDCVIHNCVSWSRESGLSVDR